jgi:hypothetical protein
MTVPTKRALIAPAIGLLVGLGIGYVDTRPTWDDAGITGGALFLAAAVLAAARPGLFWLTGLAVGLPVFAMNALLHSNYSSAIAVGFSVVGSAVGYVVGRKTHPTPRGHHRGDAYNGTEEHRRVHRGRSP